LGTLKDTRSLIFTPKRYDEVPALRYKGVPPGKLKQQKIYSYNKDVLAVLPNILEKAFIYQQFPYDWAAALLESKYEIISYLIGTLNSILTDTLQDHKLYYFGFYWFKTTKFLQKSPICRKCFGGIDFVV